MSPATPESGGVTRITKNVNTTEATACTQTSLAGRRHCTPRACGIIGIHKQGGFANAELYEGLLSLQHRGQVRPGIPHPLRLPWQYRFLELNILGSCSDYIAALTGSKVPQVGSAPAEHL
jgi:hypothetical protein